MKQSLLILTLITTVLGASVTPAEAQLKAVAKFFSRTSSSSGVSRAVPSGVNYDYLTRQAPPVSDGQAVRMRSAPNSLVNRMQTAERKREEEAQRERQRQEEEAARRVAVPARMAANILAMDPQTGEKLYQNVAGGGNFYDKHDNLIWFAVPDSDGLHFRIYDRRGNFVRREKG